jgi:hypothetical protein
MVTYESGELHLIALSRLWGERDKRIPTINPPLPPFLVKSIRDGLINANSDIRLVRSEAQERE